MDLKMDVKPVGYAILLILFAGFALFVSGAVFPAAAKEGVSAEKTVVYYFHGNRRCATCRSIEENTRKVVDSDFGKLVRWSELEFRSVNLDRSENEHFVKDFQLVSRTVVIARVAAGKAVRWKVLDKVWLLAHKPDEFRAYIKDELGDFLRQRS